MHNLQGNRATGLGLAAKIVIAVAAAIVIGCMGFVLLLFAALSLGGGIG